nr:hypothetical protein [Tabrizicola flagellatus]
MDQQDDRFGNEDEERKREYARPVQRKAVEGGDEEIPGGKQAGGCKRESGERAEEIGAQDDGRKVGELGKAGRQRPFRLVAQHEGQDECETAPIQRRPAGRLRESQRLILSASVTRVLLATGHPRRS